mgnify:CR=1 FL=1
MLAGYSRRALHARGIEAIMIVREIDFRRGLARPGLRFGVLAAVAGALATTAMAQDAAPAAKPALQAETAFTNKMPPISPHWGFLRGGFGSGGTSIFNGDTGKMVGMINTSRWSDMAIDPTNKFYYVSESIWSKGNRGVRQDMVSVYDPTTLALVPETTIPGRLLIGSRKNNFVISDDGKTGYIYNFSPASTVNVVDFEKRKLSQVVELPGCASLMPTSVGFSALCGDGTIATVAVTGRSASITHTTPFFSATNDPIFDNFIYDRGKAQATFLTYTGMVYQADISANPTVGQPWSLQAAAGLRAGETKPLDVNWLPGGRQPMALNRTTGLLYVLMHTGEYWSQKQDGTEIWVVNLAAKKVIKRVPIKKPAGNIEVSQDDKPLIFLSGDDNQAWIVDGTTYVQKYELERAGGSTIAVLDPAR